MFVQLSVVDSTCSLLNALCMNRLTHEEALGLKRVFSYIDRDEDKCLEVRQPVVAQER